MLCTKLYNVHVVHFMFHACALFLFLWLKFTDKQQIHIEVPLKIVKMGYREKKIECANVTSCQYSKYLHIILWHKHDTLYICDNRNWAPFPFPAPCSHLFSLLLLAQGVCGVVPLSYRKVIDFTIVVDLKGVRLGGLCTGSY